MNNSLALVISVVGVSIYLGVSIWLYHVHHLSLYIAMIGIGIFSLLVNSIRLYKSLRTVSGPEVEMRRP